MICSSDDDKAGDVGAAEDKRSSKEPETELLPNPMETSESSFLVHHNTAAEEGEDEEEMEGDVEEALFYAGRDLTGADLKDFLKKNFTDFIDEKAKDVESACESK